MKRSWTSCAVALALLAGVAAGESGRLAPSKEPGWPQWRGARRDGICDEKGLLRAWPEGGPRLLWSAEGLGRGWSSPIVVKDTLYVTGDVGEELHIFALDLAGKPKWRAVNGRSWKRSYPGARGSCTYSEGRIYHINAHNRIVCLDADSGKELWAVDLMERFGGHNITCAIAHHPLVDGSRVIVTPGGKKAMLAALDKTTGQTVWASQPLLFERTERFGGETLDKPLREADGPSYASPILFELGGRRHLVNCSTRHVFGADADTGKLLWRLPMPTRWEVVSNTPVLYKDSIFVTAPHGRGGMLIRLKVQADQVATEVLWRTDMDACHGGIVAVGDVLFGSWYGGQGAFGCLDATTGKTLHQTRELSMGSMIWADERLYYLAQRGEMALIDTGAKDFSIVGRFPFPGGGERKRNDVWAHPVILDGRLYLRHHEKLACYDVKASGQ